MKWKNGLLTGLCFALITTETVYATDSLNILQTNPKVETFILLQLWSSYTANERIFDPQSQQYLEVDDRFNLWFRRAIVGFQARPYSTLRFKMMTAFDGIGKDIFASANGSVNNGSMPKIGILEAYTQWQVWPDHESFYLVAGYFRPQIGRESITSSWGITSMDRALGNVYFRQHLTGSAFGRVAGLHLGGLISYSERQISLEYGLGLFNPQFAGPGGNSSKIYHPLLTTRAAIHFGDPEMKHYEVYRNVNFLGKRHGLTLAGNAAWQGASDLFYNSTTLSGDVLFNWGPLNIDGEWSILQRSGERLLPDDQWRTFTNMAQTGHIRVSYNISAGAHYIVEPSLTYMLFIGALDEIGQADAAAVGTFAGRDEGIDFGINWYIHQRKCKLLLHYNWRWGDAGASGEGSTVNSYFSQTGIGAIQRGNWLGLGVNLMF